jgi:hypothetical protein
MSGELVTEGRKVDTNERQLVCWSVPVTVIKTGVVRTRSEVGALSGCAQEGFDGHVEWWVYTAGFAGG